MTEDTTASTADHAVSFMQQVHDAFEDLSEELPLLEERINALTKYASFTQKLADAEQHTAVTLALPELMSYISSVSDKLVDMQGTVDAYYAEKGKVETADASSDNPQTEVPKAE